MRIQPWLLLAIGAASIAGCGIDFKVGNGGKNPKNAFELAANNARDVSVLSGRIDNLSRFALGLEGIVPDPSKFAGTAGFANTGTPGLAPAGAADNCFTATDDFVLPTDNVCLITDTRTNPEPGVAMVTESVLLYFPEGTANTDHMITIDYYGNRMYSDGSTSVFFSRDQEAPNGTTAADLGRHRTHIMEIHYFSEPEMPERQEALLAVNWHGVPDDSSDADRTAAGDTTDEIFYALFQEIHRDGSAVSVSWFPDAPLRSFDDEDSSGRLTQTTTFGSGPLQSSIETVHWNVSSGTAEVATLLEYDDRTTESEYYRLTATDVSGQTSGRRGRTATFYLDLQTGEFLQLTTFPESDDIERIEESGQIRETGADRLDITWTEQTYHRNGFQRTVNATIVVQGPQATITYEETDTTGDVESGTVVLVQGIASNSIEADIIDNDGIQIHVEATEFAGGAAVAHLSADDPSTPENPDWEAQLHVAPDGTVSGTITIQNEVLDIEQAG